MRSALRSSTPDDERETPERLYNEINAEFGFTLDVCSSHGNALCHNYYTIDGLWGKTHTGAPVRIGDGCGLTGSWAGHRVWCQMPFSCCDLWVQQCWEQHFSPAPPELIVALVPSNRTDISWWQEHVEPHRDTGLTFRTRHLPGRHRFTIDGGQPIYQKNKDGSLKLNKKGKPILGSPNFGVTLLIWKNRLRVR